MAETEFITNTTSSTKDNDIPFYKKYPTPTYNKDELHKTFAGVLTDYDFSMEYLPLTVAAEKVDAGFRFDKKMKQMAAQNIKKINKN